MRFFRSRKLFRRPLALDSLRSSRRRFTLEQLEPRMMLHGDPSQGPHDHPPTYDLNNFHIHAQLTISIQGEIVAIPGNIGIGDIGGQAGFLSRVHTHEADNVIHLHNVPNIPPPTEFLTLGAFFDTWRTSGGFAGNNPDAVLSSTQILGHMVDADNTLRMFVNGIETDEFEDYAIREGDNIVLVYGSNPIVTFETNQGPILIELFPDVAPITVDNFLNYINDGDYVNSIFHRLVPGFVLQGGGFTSVEEQFASIDQFEPVPTDPPIQNEFQLSNLRGTIAMAKLGSSPDSATSQWFVNLGNNSGNLDFQNGGFTVFGQVLGMWTGWVDVLPSTVDVIAGFTRSNQGGAFTDLPLDAQNNVVRVESIQGEGTVRGSVFFDLNSNGVFDAGEIGFPNFTVFVDANQNGLFDEGELTTTTDANGNYVLRLPAGTHIIRQLGEPPYFQSSPASPDFHVAEVQIGREVTGLNFGNMLLGANDDTFQVEEDSQDVVLDVLANDVVDGMSQGLTITMVGTPDQGGEVSIAPDGLSLIYTPAPDFFGTETFMYQVSGTTGSEQATVVVQVLPVNDPPTAVDDEYTVEENQTHNLFVLENDLTDPDVGETLRIIAISGIQDGAGMAVIGGNGEFIQYTPEPGFQGTVTFMYTITDRDTGGLNSSATVTVHVVDANDPPTANPDFFTVEEDSVDNEFDVLANDSIEPDVDETLSILSVNAASFSHGGSATVSEDGLRIFYTPAPDFFGVETFTYTIIDSRGATATGLVTVNVTPVNDPPTAVDDFFTFTKDTGPHLLDVLANDTIAPDEDETLTIIEASVDPAFGTVQIVNNGQRIEYTPAPGFTGDAIITYTIDDGNDGTDTAIATVTIRDFTPSRLAGFVYFDTNDNGVFDAGEAPIGGVTITLIGTDSFGEAVSLTTTTAADGSYAFENLAPGSYTISQTQPALLIDGKDTIGAQGGQAGNDQFTITLGEGANGTENNFGERGKTASLVSLMDFFAIRAEPLVVAATTPSGQAWYSASQSWVAYDQLVVTPTSDLSQVQVTAIDSANASQSVTAPTGGSQARIIRQDGQTTLVGLLVDSATFGFSAPAQGASAMAVAADELAGNVDDESADFDLDALLAAALASGEFGEDSADLAATDAVFDEIGA